MDDKTSDRGLSARRSGNKLMAQIKDRLRDALERIAHVETPKRNLRRGSDGRPIGKRITVTRNPSIAALETATVAAPEAPAEVAVAKPERIRLLEAEVQGLKKTLHEVMASVQGKQDHYLPEMFRQVQKRLCNNEVHEGLAKAVIDAVYSQTQPSESQDRRLMEKRVALLVLQLIKQAPRIESVTSPAHRVALIGPTGVGKTTTLAKIAANLKLTHGRKVALITADTFRIAAIEQLQTFANIAGIPLSVVYSPTEMEQEVARYKDYDFILIDTVGRSQKNQRQLHELKQFLTAADPHEKHLVLSLTNSRRTLFDVASRFAELEPNRFIFTKLDESTTPGVMLNLIYRFQLPVSYITTGQTVPTDLKNANMKMIAKLILYGIPSV
ncbi:MAG: DEAD/DEAH box helicase family protein [Calditrichia bacterium]